MSCVMPKMRTVLSGLRGVPGGGRKGELVNLVSTFRIQARIAISPTGPTDLLSGDSHIDFQAFLMSYAP